MLLTTLYLRQIEEIINCCLASVPPHPPTPALSFCVESCSHCPLSFSLSACFPVFLLFSKGLPPERMLPESNYCFKTKASFKETWRSCCIRCQTLATVLSKFQNYERRAQKGVHGEIYKTLWGFKGRFGVESPVNQLGRRKEVATKKIKLALW